MKKLFLISFAMLSLIFMVTSCGKKGPESVAEKFANAFVKYDMEEAKKYATPQSAELLDAIGSAVTPEAKEAAKGAKATFVSVNNTSDTTAVVNFTISNFVEINFFNNDGEPFNILPEKKDFNVNMLKVDDKWLANVSKDDK